MTWSDTFSGSYLQGLIARALPHEHEDAMDEHVIGTLKNTGPLTISGTWDGPNESALRKLFTPADDVRVEQQEDGTTQVTLHVEAKHLIPGKHKMRITTTTGRTLTVYFRPRRTPPRYIYANGHRIRTKR